MLSNNHNNCHYIKIKIIDLIFVALLGVVFLLVTYYIFTFAKPKEVFTYGINLSATLDNLLTQQSNIMSWFTLIATFILAIMGAITAYGYFNTRDIAQKTKQFDLWQESLMSSNEKIKQVGSFFNHIKKIETEVNEIKIPCSLTLPLKQEIHNIQNEIVKIKVLEYTGVTINNKQKLINALGAFYNKNYNDVLSILDTTDDKSELSYITFLRGMSYYQSMNYDGAIDAFITVIKLQSNFSIAYWYLINSLMKMDEEMEESKIKAIVDNMGIKDSDSVFLVITIYWLLLQNPIDYSEVNNKVLSLKNNNPLNNFYKLLEYEVRAQEFLEKKMRYNPIENETEDEIKRTLDEFERQYIENIKNAIKYGKEMTQFMRYQENIYQKYLEFNEAQGFLQMYKVSYGNPNILNIQN